ncbi:hypothetical protein TrRE_jg10443 [Triparma retinervis]|uniref:AB hydrolase-1 domain-containing protein n=1 Tax=Triparma retinervis TaxID=2557542 RepID=A0A9W7DXN9_9STRA|nr:hypothetical protein TrRE_jg10443 [Triparma retinervis]
MIWPIKAIVPMTALGLMWRVFKEGGRITLSWWNVHAGAELLFFFWYVYHKRALNAMKPTADQYEYMDLDKQQSFDPVGSLEENISYFDDILKGVGKAREKYAMRRHEIVKWFCDPSGNMPEKLEHLREGDIKSWFAWAFFRKDYYGRTEEVEEDCGEELERMVHIVEAWIKYEFPPGRNHPNITPIRLTLDGIRSVPHPIIHYVVTHFGCVTAAKICFKMRGFTSKKVGGVDFWTKAPKSGKESGPAIVVISGIGIGLVAYVTMIDGLLKNYPNRRFILSDLPEYSMRVTAKVDIVSPRNRATALATIIGEGGAHVIGHSLGSVVISWLIRLAPVRTVRGCTFIDPVCFFLFNASVAANFCYRIPLTPLDCLVSYFVGKELYVSNALHRHFRWDLNALRPKMLEGIPTAVILADHDHFVPSHAVERHLAANAKHVRVTTLKDHSHAQFCVMPSSTAKILEEIKMVDDELNNNAKLEVGARRWKQSGRSRSVNRRK